MKNVVLVVLFLLFSFLSLHSIFANGGDQRVVEGTYLINLSRSPFTPKAGDNIALIASFVDIQTGKLINEDLIVKVRIAKLGEGRDKREFIFEKENMMVRGGILELQYVFSEPGLHEVFFDFAFASNSQKVYRAPDFLLDVQRQDVYQSKSSVSIGLWLIFGLLIGFVVGRLFGRKVM